jgi:hypothetical protein
MGRLPHMPMDSMRGWLFRKLPGFPGIALGWLPSEESLPSVKRLWAGMRRASAGALKGPLTSGLTPQCTRATTTQLPCTTGITENFHDAARGCGHHHDIDGLESPDSSYARPLANRNGCKARVIRGTDCRKPRSPTFHRPKSQFPPKLWLT